MVITQERRIFAVNAALGEDVLVFQRTIVQGQGSFIQGQGSGVIL